MKKKEKKSVIARLSASFSKIVLFLKKTKKNILLKLKKRK